MMDRNKQKQARTEVTYQTLSEFLQSAPPKSMEAYLEFKSTCNASRSRYSSLGAEINTPELGTSLSTEFVRWCSSFSLH